MSLSHLHPLNPAPAPFTKCSCATFRRQAGSCFHEAPIPALPLLTAAFASGVCLAQSAPTAVPVSDSPVVLDWTPPALAELSTMAAMKNSFTLDRSLLGAAASVLPDSEAPAKQAIAKLDGVSVHLLRFGADGIPDERAVDAIRDSYHLRGWKHIVTTSHGGGPIHNDVTDVWMVLDGVNVRGAVVLAETARA